jgi:hypothetical protein
MDGHVSPETHIANRREERKDGTQPILLAHSPQPTERLSFWK